MRVKDTLNLGKTKFKMRGHLPVKEAQRQQVWLKNHVYERRQKLNQGKPSFVLHDGPPYANGDIHMGHAMNKISKDIIVRYKSMNGYRAPYVPGWDTHGLPIEEKLTKAGYNRKKMSTNAFRKLCRNYALKEVRRQKKEFMRLGVMADWQHPYLTLHPKFEAAEIRVFGKMAKKGLIYRGRKPVLWSWSSESALAEAEVEYHKVTSPTAFYVEKVVDGKGVLDNSNTYIVVWTTTPWTIPASEGITVNPNFSYSVVAVDGDSRHFVVGTERLKRVAQLIGWKHVKTLKTVQGRQLERVIAQHPFIPSRKLLTMCANFVTADSGTELVHTAPGLGEDDYNVGRKYGLPILVHINAQGYLTKQAGKDFEGLFYEKANRVALDKLKQNHALLKFMPYKHDYPFDWRTKKPVVYRATPQWFASVDKIKPDILKNVDKVKYFPSWGKKRLHNMIAARGDWVISRQRVWGVPLPIFYAEDGTAIITPETINHVADLVAKYGSGIWFKEPAKKLLPNGYTNSHSPHGKFTKETDIMDVWFDSGSSHQGVLAERKDLTYPADLYLEGSDQYRGWFNSSIITSTAYSNQPPYKQLVSQVFVLDKHGRKMCKSVGNTIAPIEVIKRLGAEIVRLWVVSVDTSADVRASMGGFTKVAGHYKKIRNTMRYMLSNVNDFDPKRDSVKSSQLSSLDRYMLLDFNEFVKNVKNDYDHYDTLSIYKLLMSFVSNDLSAFYMNVAKDILYIDPENSTSRRAMQTVIYRILVGLTKLLTPILPHTMEEIWPFLHEPEDFAALSEMPKVNDDRRFRTFYGHWRMFMSGLREDVLKSLEKARDAKLIGKPSAARLDLYLDANAKKNLDSLKANVRQVLMVSQLAIHPLSDAPKDADQYQNGVAIQVTHAKGRTCRRCRMIKQDVGTDSAYPDFCARCAEIVRKEFPETVKDGFDDD